MSRLAREISALACRRETWMRDALDDVLHGRPHPWIARRAEIAHLIEQAEPVLTALGPVTDVQVQGDAAGTRLPRGRIARPPAGRREAEAQR